MIHLNFLPFLNRVLVYYLPSPLTQLCSLGNFTKSNCIYLIRYWNLKVPVFFLRKFHHWMATIEDIVVDEVYKAENIYSMVVP